MDNLDLQLKSETQSTISKKVIRQNILRLAWPVILEMALVTLVEIADMMMVGQLGVEALSSIGLTLQPLMLNMVIFNGLSVGTTALVARFTGEKNLEEANRTFNQSISGAIILALVMGSLLFSIAPYILIVMGAKTSNIIKLGTGYIRWLVPGLFFQWQFVVISSALRGSGDTITPMIINGIINIINVTGNYLLIFGKWFFPALGVYGAAIASSTARVTGFLILIIFLHTRNSGLKICPGKLLKFDRSLLGRIVKIGIPAALEQTALRTGQILYTRIINSLGVVAIAAHNTAINAESISYMPGWGFSVAATAMVGQKLGEQKPLEAEASGRESLKFGIFIMTLMGIIFLVFPEYLMKMYVNLKDPNAIEMIRLGAGNLRIVALAQIPMATQFVLAGALRGAGYTKPVLFSTLIGVWCGRLLGAYIFVFHLKWGLWGAWIAMNIDWYLRCIYVVYLWKKGEWKKVRV